MVSSLGAAELHVAVNGNDANPGTVAAPLRTIQKGAELAQPGDVVTVHAGVYRERVNPPRGGESDSKRIVYQAAPGEKVVITGSEAINTWEKVQDGVWKVTLPNGFFNSYNPYSDIINGEWHKDIGYPRHTGTVYLNGIWMDESKSLDQVMGVGSGRPLWKAEVDEKNTTIWAKFPGIDPNKERVEINVRQSVFYPDKPGRNYITVRGFTMRHAATPWSGAMSEQVGLIGTHWSKGWIIENNVISHSMNTGITLGRYDLRKHGIAMPAVSAPGFIKSCELALEHGWSKEKIGGHMVRNNHISHCEKNGIHGSLGGVFSIIEGNTICDIAVRGWIGGDDVAGLKLLASNDTVIRGNHIYRCRGYGGIWLDWMAQGTRVTGNLFHDNSMDLFVEVNHGPILVDNNIFLSKVAVGEASEGGAYVHNLFAGAINQRKETRQTPIFKPHTLQYLGVFPIGNGDERFNSNLFFDFGLQEYNDREAIQMKGNVFVGKAKPSVHEKIPTILSDRSGAIKLVLQKDGVYLQADLSVVTSKHMVRPLVTTELLGEVIVAKQGFVNPDGLPLRIETDYFGKPRSDKNPAPGPFEQSGHVPSGLKVWGMETR